MGDAVTAVKKVEENALDSALPATSFTAVPTFKVYVPFNAKAADGVTVALLPEQVTAPAMALPLDVRVTLLPVAVAQLINSEKFTDTVVLDETPVMPLAGVTLTTVGGVVSGTGAGGVAALLPPPPHAANAKVIAVAIRPFTAVFITHPLCEI